LITFNDDKVFASRTICGDFFLGKRSVFLHALRASVFILTTEAQEKIQRITEKMDVIASCLTLTGKI